MSQIEFFHYEAFTDTPGMGNPAGIVFDPEGMLAEEEMQRIAAAVGFNETAFVLPSGREECSLRLRFFAPGSEMPLCGHGTVAAVSALAARDGLRGNRAPRGRNTGRRAARRLAGRNPGGRDEAERRAVPALLRKHRGAAQDGRPDRSGS